MNKAPIISAWRAALEGRLATLQSSQDAARSGTRVDGEHRPSNRGERAAVTSQGYLAHAFEARSLALRSSLEQLDDMGSDPRDEVVIGALLHVVVDGDEPHFIALLPGGDASKITVGNHTITILSANSPLAQQIRDAEVDETLEVDLGATVCELTLLSIA